MRPPMFAQALGEYGMLVGAINGAELLAYEIRDRIFGIDTETRLWLGAIALGILFFFWIRRPAR